MTSTDAQVVQLFSAVAVVKSLFHESVTGLFKAHVPIYTSYLSIYLYLVKLSQLGGHLKG